VGEVVFRQTIFRPLKNTAHGKTAIEHYCLCVIMAMKVEVKYRVQIEENYRKVKKSKYKVK
jgi:hypothetical protein